ncbi:grainyhead-like protein 2 homolog isoform X3 [Bolinopsis microptera]|uniref:grainyhead-like protein 2 homolog isoform X3 n=1 Tax=Bolinopsis microptera TaxID=2820187 RepID=UPI00307A0B2D
MSSLPSLALDQPLSDFSAAVSGRKKITDAFINQAYKELVENPMEAYNMDVQSPSVPISFLYDLSNEPSSRNGQSNIGLLRTASSSDIASFNFDEFTMPAMPTERSLSAPCISANTDDQLEVTSDGGGDGGTLTLKDLDKQLLAHVAANTSSPNQNMSIFNNQYKYEFILDAPISIVQKKGDDTLTYLNKGQYYKINFLSNPNTRDRLDFNLKVKSIVHLVFRNQDRRKEHEYWTYWYAQQPNANIRVFDVDERACKNVEEINEIGCNAVSFSWNSNIGATIVLRINCLSTEFSSQKGVKGTPLYIQTDTFEDTESLNPEPADRCYCQIKVFRDKGAERKNKDESRTADRKLQKLLKNGQIPPSDQDPNNIVTTVFHKPCKQTVLTKTTVLSPKPVIFTAPVRNLSFSVNGVEDMQAPLAPIPEQKFYGPNYHVTTPTYQVSQLPQLLQQQQPTSDFGNQLISSMVNNTGGGGVPGYVDVGSGSTCSVSSTVTTVSDHSPDSTWGSPNKQNNDSLFAFIRDRESKRSISQALTTSGTDPQDNAHHMNNAGPSDELNDRPSKQARIQSSRPVTIYVKKTEERVYSALCLTKFSLDGLKEEVASKYAIPKNMPVKLYKRTRKGLLIHMDSRMVEQFQDEDDFLVEVNFQNKEGIFEVTFLY